MQAGWSANYLEKIKQKEGKPKLKVTQKLLPTSWAVAGCEIALMKRVAKYPGMGSFKVRWEETK